MQNFRRNGRSIDCGFEKDVKGGDLVVLSDMVAVASTDIPAGETGACEAEGVFDLPKDTSVILQGEAVYADINGTITTTAEGNVRAGVAWTYAAANDPVAVVKING